VPIIFADVRRNSKVGFGAEGWMGGRGVREVRAHIGRAGRQQSIARRVVALCRIFAAYLGCDATRRLYDKLGTSFDP